MSRFSPVEASVIRILAYSAVFGDSVLLNNLTRYQSGNVIFSQKELVSASRQLEDKGILRRFSKQVNHDILQQKWRSVGRALRFLHPFSAIESIWVTGGLAVQNIQAADDVDLMIVTYPNTLWLTRAQVSVHDLFQKRIRRRSDHDELLKDKWCCNLWLESSSLALQPDQHSLYAAREVIQAIPIFARSPGSAQKFLEANRWVQKFLPVGFELARQRAQAVPILPAPAILRLHWLNQIFFWLQSHRMKSYLRHEIVEHRRAFFHPGERAQEVQRRYERILKSVF